MPSQPIMQTKPTVPSIQCLNSSISEPASPTQQPLHSSISKPGSPTRQCLNSTNSQPTSPTRHHSSISVPQQAPITTTNTPTPSSDTSKAVKDALSLVNTILQTHDTRIKQKSRFQVFSNILSTIV